MQSLAIWGLIFAALIFANLPWLGDRFFFFFTPSGGIKKIWMRLLEWFVLYFVVGLAAMGLEKKFNGVIHHQTWQFYTVTFCLFLVFALPGFIYHTDLKHRLRQR